MARKSFKSKTGTNSIVLVLWCTLGLLIVSPKCTNGRHLGEIRTNLKGRPVPVIGQPERNQKPSEQLLCHYFEERTETQQERGRPKGLGPEAECPWFCTQLAGGS